ncbi:MAG: monofunctional biosynthetic peptidoglycan transglycosylase [Burkholderia sp.]
MLVGTWLITQLCYFTQIAFWSVIDLGFTAFMRADAWHLKGETPPVTIQHRWVPYEQISRNLKRAVIASEDADFASKTTAMRSTRSCRPGRGTARADASSPAARPSRKQLARNLFLSSQKSYLHKGQELIITWMLETLLDKERIFEIYLNSVEFGRGVYGAEAAARYYFRVPASQLTAWQAARLAVVLPNPKFFDAHRNSPYLAQRMRVIARRMGAAKLPASQ